MVHITDHFQWGMFDLTFQFLGCYFVYLILGRQSEMAWKTDRRGIWGGSAEMTTLQLQRALLFPRLHSNPGAMVASVGPIGGSSALSWHRGTQPASFLAATLPTGLAASNSTPGNFNSLVWVHTLVSEGTSEPWPDHTISLEGHLPLSVATFDGFWWRRTEQLFGIKFCTSSLCFFCPSLSGGGGHREWRTRQWTNKIIQ